MRESPRHRREEPKPVQRTAWSDEILTTAEVAKRLKVPIHTIYRWVAMGTAPKHYKVGKHLRWKWSDVLAWLEEHADEVSSGR